jgi:hypothetical protein
MIVAKSNIIESYRDQCMLMNGKHIKRITQTRILGVQIDENLSWNFNANCCDKL